MNRTVLIDGHNFLFRYFRGMPTTIFSSDGRLIHTAYGMIAAVLKMIRQFAPTSRLNPMARDERGAAGSWSVRIRAHPC